MKSKDFPIGTVAFYGPDDRHATKVAYADRIIGCPHEEGIDYPKGMAKCPRCLFWANRDRWTGEIEQ